MIHVVAAAVTDGGGRVLIAERPPGKQLAGHWEFPGGKLEPRETRTEGLARELREELGITVRDPRPLMRVRHAYEFGEVLIDMWVVSRYDGEPQGLDGQRLRWCALEELDGAGLLPADQPLVRALRLPQRLTSASSRFYAISDPLLAKAPAVVTFWEQDTPMTGQYCTGARDARRAVAMGAEFVVLRTKLLDVELSELCETLAVPVFALGIELEHAWKQGASGVSEL